MEIASKEDFDRLETEVVQLRDLIKTLLTVQGAPVIDAKEVARREGINTQSVYKNDYRHYLPNFGVSDYPEGRVRWKLETYMKWVSIPVTERKRMWSNMSSREREQIVLSKKPA